jgi:hypothetical protein
VSILYDQNNLPLTLGQPEIPATTARRGGRRDGVHFNSGSLYGPVVKRAPRDRSHTFEPGLRCYSHDLQLCSPYCSTDPSRCHSANVFDFRINKNVEGKKQIMSSDLSDGMFWLLRRTRWENEIIPRRRRLHTQGFQSSPASIPYFR